MGVMADMQQSVKALSGRMATGETWLRQNPRHVKYTATLDSQELGSPEANYQALTPRGQAALDLYKAVALAHEYGKQIVGLDSELEQARQRGDDEAVAVLLRLIAFCWQDWERAREALALAESKTK